MADSAFPQPPPGLNYIAAIEPSLTILLINVILSSFLVPTLIVILYTSTQATRRKPIFIMNIVSIVLAFALAAINTYNLSRTILAKPVDPKADTASASMLILAPYFAELTLVVRVVSVYPPRLMSWSGRILMYAPIALLKTARTANVIDFLVAWGRLNRDAFTPSVTSQQAWGLPNAKIEWILQFLDMLFVSALFLARLRQGVRMKRDESRPHCSSVTSTGTRVSLSSRIRTLFWIAASNLIFPVLLDFIQLVYIFHDNSSIPATYVVLVNVHVQIIGVLLATIWGTSISAQQYGPTTGSGGEYHGGRREDTLVTSEVTRPGR
ncbi:hypothetical protein ONZ51_g167 [Trametes cubensis]|uniref:Uncharacterized protein n=1 Tax=Trametes cubensis TaxID=1111947 RepID=A0AAD7U5X2_9APHY|nr:hypothetical protein ONZ51_g167 [Trametes cubensis]